VVIKVETKVKSSRRTPLVKEDERTINMEMIVKCGCARQRQMPDKVSVGKGESMWATRQTSRLKSAPTIGV
jgi:hypothetical protein